MSHESASAGRRRRNAGALAPSHAAGRLRRPGATVGGEAGQCRAGAWICCGAWHFDAVLLDIHMPGADGLALARALRSLAAAAGRGVRHRPCRTRGGGLRARGGRLPDQAGAAGAAAGRRCRRSNGWSRRSGGAQPTSAPEVLLIQDRGRTERVPLAEVLYFKAELKYITVRTAASSHILDASLSELEERYADAVPAGAPQCPGGAPRHARARETLRSRGGRGLGRAPERHRRAARGIAAPAGCGARGCCGLRLASYKGGKHEGTRCKAVAAPIAAPAGCRPGGSLARTAARAGERAQHGAGGAHGAGACWRR